MDRTSSRRGGSAPSPYSSYTQAAEHEEDRVILSGVSSLIYDPMEAESTAPNPPPSSSLPESTLMPPPPPKPKKAVPSPINQPKAPILVPPAAPVPEPQPPVSEPAPADDDDDDDIDGVPIDLSQLASIDTSVSTDTMVCLSEM